MNNCLVLLCFLKHSQVTYSSQFTFIGNSKFELLHKVICSAPCQHIILMDNYIKHTGHVSNSQHENSATIE